MLTFSLTCTGETEIEIQRDGEREARGGRPGRGGLRTRRVGVEKRHRAGSGARIGVQAMESRAHGAPRGQERGGADAGRGSGRPDGVARRQARGSDSPRARPAAGASASVSRPPPPRKHAPRLTRWQEAGRFTSPRPRADDLLGRAFRGLKPARGPQRVARAGGQGSASAHEVTAP